MNSGSGNRPLSDDDNDDDNMIIIIIKIIIIIFLKCHKIVTLEVLSAVKLVEKGQNKQNVLS